MGSEESGRFHSIYVAPGCTSFQIYSSVHKCKAWLFVTAQNCNSSAAKGQPNHSRLCLFIYDSLKQAQPLFYKLNCFPISCARLAQLLNHCLAIFARQCVNFQMGRGGSDSGCNCRPDWVWSPDDWFLSRLAGNVQGLRQGWDS